MTSNVYNGSTSSQPNDGSIAKKDATIRKSAPTSYIRKSSLLCLIKNVSVSIFLSLFATDYVSASSSLDTFVFSEVGSSRDCASSNEKCHYYTLPYAYLSVTVLNINKSEEI